MSRQRRGFRISERVYRALLVVYPKRFRDVYGAQMLQVFRDSLQESYGKRGFAVLTRFWIRTLLDLVRSAVIERKRTNADGTASKDPTSAAVLSLLWIGLGQVYNGQWTKGWALALFGAGWLWMFFSGAAAAGNIYVAATVVGLAVQSWSVWDAYRIANRVGPAVRGGSASSRGGA